MRRGFIAFLVAVLAVLTLGVAGAQASASASNADGTMTGQTASSADPGYFGLITAKPTACVVLERKDNAGNWKRDGFAQGQFTFSVFRVCHDSTVNPEDWRIHTNVYQVTGLRFVSNQGLTKTLCNGNCSSALA